MTPINRHKFKENAKSYQVDVQKRPVITDKFGRFDFSILSYAIVIGRHVEGYYQSSNFIKTGEEFAVEFVIDDTDEGLQFRALRPYGFFINSVHKLNIEEGETSEFFELEQWKEAKNKTDYSPLGFFVFKSRKIRREDAGDQYATVNPFNCRVITEAYLIYNTRLYNYDFEGIEGQIAEYFKLRFYTFNDEPYEDAYSFFNERYPMQKYPRWVVKTRDKYPIADEAFRQLRVNKGVLGELFESCTFIPAFNLKFICLGIGIYSFEWPHELGHYIFNNPDFRALYELFYLMIPPDEKFVNDHLYHEARDTTLPCQRGIIYMLKTLECEWQFAYFYQLFEFVRTPGTLMLVYAAIANCVGILVLSSELRRLRRIRMLKRQVMRERGWSSGFGRAQRIMKMFELKLEKKQRKLAEYLRE